MIKNIQLTLIQTSRDRIIELRRFVDSLNNSVGIDFSRLQFVFVDQGNNESVFTNLNKEIRFDYIKTNPCSLSVARNIGLRSVVGEFVCFPDDDCWYENDTIKTVFNLFKEGYSGVVGYGSDENGLPTNTFAEKTQLISRYNHCGAISYTIFLKYKKGILFDENLGVGSPLKFLSGEETDYLIRFMNDDRGNLIYSTDVHVHHPSARSDYFENETKKMYYYARGYGYLMRKHSYPVMLIAKSLIRPLGGIIIYALTLDRKKSIRSWNILKGRVEGYIESKLHL